MKDDGVCMHTDIEHTVVHQNFVGASNSQGGVEEVASPLNSLERETGACYNQSATRPSENMTMDVGEHLGVLVYRRERKVLIALSSSLQP